jgi:hypothetical protein
MAKGGLPFLRRKSGLLQKLGILKDGILDPHSLDEVIPVDRFYWDPMDGKFQDHANQTAVHMLSPKAMLSSIRRMAEGIDSSVLLDSFTEKKARSLYKGVLGAGSDDAALALIEKHQKDTISDIQSKGGKVLIAYSRAELEEIKPPTFAASIVVGTPPPKLGM